MSNETNIFEKATRAQLRFNSSRGLITTEDLWLMSLTSKNGFDLDTVARDTNRQLKQMEEESFVETKSNPQKATTELAMEIIKHIIAVKMAENAATRDAKNRKEERDLLLALLNEKQVEELKGLTKEQIEARIAALG